MSHLTGTANLSGEDLLTPVLRHGRAGSERGDLPQVTQVTGLLKATPPGSP